MTRRQAHLLLMFSALVWGTLHPISKLLLAEGLTPNHVALSRFTLCALTMLVAAAATGRIGRLTSLPRRGLLAVVLIGLCGYFASVSLALRGLTFLNASMSSLLANTAPLFVALLSPVVLREAPSSRAVLGLLAGFAGVAVLVQSGSGPGGAVSPVGVLLSLSSAGMWALYTVLGRWSGARVDPVLFTLIASAASAVPLLAIVLAEDRPDALLGVSPQGLLGLAWLGVVATGLTFFIWTAALRRLTAASVAAYSYLIPVFAVLFAVALLGEQPNALFVLGAVLVLAGVAGAQR